MIFKVGFNSVTRKIKKNNKILLKLCSKVHELECNWTRAKINEPERG
jgi:hypothetical protein